MRYRTTNETAQRNISRLLAKHIRMGVCALPGNVHNSESSVHWKWPNRASGRPAAKSSGGGLMPDPDGYTVVLASPDGSAGSVV